MNFCVEIRLGQTFRTSCKHKECHVSYDASLHFTRCWATSQAKVGPFVTGLLTAVSRHRYARDHQSESVSHIKWSSCESVTVERQISAGTKLQGKHYKLLTLPSHGNGHQHHSQTQSPGRRSHRKKETRRDVSVISGIPSWSPAPSNDVSLCRDYTWKTIITLNLQLIFTGLIFSNCSYDTGYLILVFESSNA